MGFTAATLGASCERWGCRLGARQTAVQVERVEARAEEERRPPMAVVVLGAVALALLAAFSMVGVALGAAGGRGAAACRCCGAVGALSVYDAYVCNVAGSDVSVTARVVEAPPEVEVFLLYVNGTVFGYRYGNYTPLNAAFKAGQCLPARLEVLIDAKAQPSRVYTVTVEFTSYTR